MKRLLILLGLIAAAGPAFGATCATDLTLCPSPRYLSMTVGTGTFTGVVTSTLSATGAVSGAGFTALFASPPAIGGTAAAAGTFTAISSSTLAVSGAITGGGITALFASPPPIGSTLASTGAFSTLRASGQFTSTVSTGTAPFVINSTTVVGNLNASTLSGATFAAPGPIGSSSPSTGAFTTSTFSGAITSTLVTGTAPFVVASTTVVANLNVSALGGATFAAPGPIGSGTPGTGAFTTLAASSTVSGAGITALFASPPAIGGTAAAAAAFTTLTASSTVTLSPANQPVTMSPSGTGLVTINPATAGAMNNMNIGASTRGTALFTTVGASGLITPTSTVGIAGTTTSDNAQAGSIGEEHYSFTSNTNTAVTITIASPGVITWNANGFSNTEVTLVQFTTTGALPTGLAVGTYYFTVPGTVTANTFQLATTAANAYAGTAINTSGSQSGVQTAYNYISGSNVGFVSAGVIRLTAGDWEVSGSAGVVSSGAGLTGFAAIIGQNNPVSSCPPNLFTAIQCESQINMGTAIAASGLLWYPVPLMRISVSSTTLFYLGIVQFGTATAQITYGAMHARRAR